MNAMQPQAHHRRPSNRTRQKQELAPRRDTRARILLIEDDPLTREALALLLGYYDFEVTAAGDGGEAMALLTDLTPDLVVMDWHMPGLSGLRLCMALRRRWKMLPIIVVTSTEDETTDGERPVNAWLRKPIDPPLLNQVIRRELDAPV